METVSRISKEELMRYKIDGKGIQYWVLGSKDCLVAVVSTGENKEPLMNHLVLTKM